MRGNVLESWVDTGESKLKFGSRWRRERDKSYIPCGTEEYSSFLWCDIMVTSLCGSNVGACELAWGDEFESTLKSFSMLSSAF